MLEKWLILSNPIFHEEIKSEFHDLLVQNGYPLNFINFILQHKRHNNNVLNVNNKLSFFLFLL